MLTSSKKLEKLDIPGTREMQGIVGQASDFCWVCLKDRLNSPARDLMKKDRKKSKTSNVVVRSFFLREHISPRTSSTVVRVQVVGVCEVRTLAGMPGLVIVLDPALRLPIGKKENVEERSTVVRS